MHSFVSLGLRKGKPYCLSSLYAHISPMFVFCPTCFHISHLCLFTHLTYVCFLSNLLPHLTPMFVYLLMFNLSSFSICAFFIGRCGQNWYNFDDYAVRYYRRRMFMERKFHTVCNNLH